MDWNTRSPLTSNFQTNNVQIQEQHQSQQFTETSFQANASVQNSCTYSGNDQTIKILSNRMNTLSNNMPFQNPGGSNTFNPILPKTSAHHDIQPAHLVLTLHPNSFGHVSSENVQMAAGMTQNLSLTKNGHISSPVQGSTENPMQNIPQKTVSYNNRPLQNRSNSKTASVYYQNSKRTIYPKGLPTPIRYYHANGPATSQIDATVPFNQASTQYSNSQQNLSCLVFPLQQNTQNKINGPSSSLTAALPSQYYSPNIVSPMQYGVPAYHNSNNAAQTFPQDRNPPPYSVPPAQKNHGQFVLPQAVANISHENVQSYHRPMLDQSSNLYSAQPSEKHQSVPFTRETSEVGKTPYNVSGYRTANQLPNELAKSSVEVGENLCNSVRVVGTAPSDVALTPQKDRTSEQEKNLANGSRHFPEILKDKITKERLALDGKKLHELKKAISKLDKHHKMRCQMYLSSVQNGQATDTSIHNQNAATSLPSYNTNLNLSLPLPKDSNQAIQLLPHDTTQSFPPMSSSGEVKYVPLSMKTNDHLEPILRNMLKGTTDENMLFNDYVEKGGSRHLDIKDNSSSAPMLSTSDVSETRVNKIDDASRLRTNITMDSTQVPLTCTKNVPGYELTTGSAIDELVSWSKSAMETTNQYFIDNVQSSYWNPPASNGSSLSKEEAEYIEQSNTSLQKIERKTVAGSNENIHDTFNSASLPKVTVQEAGIMQKSSVTGSPSVTTEVSWEAIKKGLALWTRKLPETLKHLRKNKNLTVSSFLSEIGVDGETQQTLEKLPSALTQKDQTKVTVESNETAASSTPSSLGKKLDVVNSNLLKGSELQVAIVTPLIMSKESIQHEVQKKTHSSLLEVMYPIIEDNSGRSLQGLSSLVPAADEGAGGTLSLSSNTGITVKKEDIDMPEKNTKSSEENLIVKAEMNKDCLIHQVSQKDAKSYKSRSDLQEPGDTVEVLLKDTVFEISSVCTLVQGDKFYNSEIAYIFNSPLKSSKKNDTSEEYMPSLHHSEQHSGLLKRESEISTSASEGDTLLPSQDRLADATTEKLLDELSSLEIPQSGKASNEGNLIDSEKGKSSSMPQSTPLSGEKLEQDTLYDGIHSADFSSDNEVLPVYKGNIFGGGIADGTDAAAKEDATKNALCEENQPDSGIYTEAPKIINDQLTELLKEFPYGISFPEALKTPENTKFVTKLSEKEDEGKPQSSVETPSQIQITILTSEQMKEMFPERGQSSSNIPKNCDDDQEENKRHSRTDQAVPYDSRNISTQTTAAEPSKPIYCCLQGWLALTMSAEPCKCMLSGKVASKQEVDICPQSETLSKVKTEADAKTGLQENESKIDPEIVPLSSLEKLGSQELNIPVKQEMEEVLLPTSSTLKTKTIEIKIQNHTRERDNVSADKTQCHSSAKDLKVAAARTVSKIETSVTQRTSKEKLVRSKTDHRRRIEKKRNTYHERYKIKRDSSETHIIKGPTLSKGLKRKMAIEKKHKALVNQHNDAIKSPNINSIKIKSPQHKSNKLSPEHLNVRNKLDFEKNYGYKKNLGHLRINNEASSTEHIEHNEESIQRKNLKLNLERFAYSKEKKNAGNYRSCHLDASPKHMNHTSNILKIPFSVKDTVLDTRNREKRLERSLSDKKACFSRRTGRLSISLQREQKKKYLNQVAFKRIAQKTIWLTNLDSHSKPVWHVKSSSVSALCEDQKNSSASSLQPEVEKPQMLEFKMCPEILFRKIDSEEQLLDGKNLPEKDKNPITAVKSKREDWLNYNPVKRRKTEECEAQVNDIPLDTAIKLLEGMPVKDSKATFQTYKKMHLEKRSRSLDSTPLN